jgi:hypothetical protein
MLYYSTNPNITTTYSLKNKLSLVKCDRWLKKFRHTSIKNAFSVVETAHSITICFGNATSGRKYTFRPTEIVDSFYENTNEYHGVDCFHW